MFLPYINMHPPRVYMCSPSWTPLPPPSPYHPCGSSQCISPKHLGSCIKPGLAIHFTYDSNSYVKFNKQKPQIDLEGQKEELSNTLAVTQPNRKKEDSFSFLARNQLIKSHAYLLCPLTLLPSSRKGLSFPVEPGLTCGSPCWQISPDSDLFLLDKYLTFQFLGQ